MTNLVSDEHLYAAFLLGMTFARDVMPNRAFEELRPQIEREVARVLKARGFDASDAIESLDELAPAERSNEEYQREQLTYLRSIADRDFTPVDDDVPQAFRHELQEGCVAVAGRLAAVLSGQSPE